jgi:methionyl-tRNA synthetase
MYLSGVSLRPQYPGKNEKTMSLSKTYYITTPIYYVNDEPHIGHVYTTTVADVMARFHRLAGRDVFFLTGTDEHAAKVVDSAAARGLTPIQWADRNAESFEKTFAKLAISNNDFIRTTQDRHKIRVQKYVKALMDSGDVYLGEYEGWYDAGQEEYVTDAKAKEDEYKSAINGKPLVRKTEKNYFFKLSAYREELLAILERGEKVMGCSYTVQPEARKNEIINRIREMNDVPISRTGQGDWGINIPGDDAHKIYVWIDALFNYISTVDTDERRKYWPADVHMLAKDILWFHAAIWPAMLLALKKQPGFDWVGLPAVIYSHSFWIREGRKMGKSTGNFVDLKEIDSYINTFSLDALRYFLAAEGPLGTNDSDFAKDKFIEAYNGALANTLGNSFSRTLNMTSKYFTGILPEVTAQTGDETLTADVVAQQVSASLKAYEALDLSGAINHALGIVRKVDEFIEKTRPFTLAKDPANLPRVAAILYHCAEALRIASVLLWPVMPGKMEDLWSRFKLDYAAQIQAAGGTGKLADWTRWGQLKPGTAIAIGEPLFPRYQPPKA